MARFPTDPWFKELVERINASDEYREAAATWEGDIAFVIEAEPDKRMPEDVWGFLDLWHGECRGGGVVEPEEGSAARYVIRAPYSRWKEVLRGDLDPVKGMMQGKLRVQGDLPTIVRYVRAANELVHLTGTVETEFPDEVPA
ncbi:MAG TPA: SCP2 sterol-binding domain-containing protein [Actinomycetota bacterium]|jgi:putative sterol carrier protein|nr:SCP2 sterol-binding domain-containing protein [Actinomycetota bacterium]